MNKYHVLSTVLLLVFLAWSVRNSTSIHPAADIPKPTLSVLADDATIWRSAFARTNLTLLLRILTLYISWLAIAFVLVGLKPAVKAVTGLIQAFSSRKKHSLVLACLLLQPFHAPIAEGATFMYPNGTSVVDFPHDVVFKSGVRAGGPSGILFDTQNKADITFDAGPDHAVQLVTSRFDLVGTTLNLTGLGKVNFDQILSQSLLINGTLITTTDSDIDIVLSPKGGGVVRVGKTLDVRGVTLLLDDDQISGDKIEGGVISAVTITNLTTTQLNIEIIGTDVKLAAGKTLDVSEGTLQLRDGQISGDKIRGGTIDEVTIITLTVNEVKAETLNGNMSLVAGRTLDVSQGTLKLAENQISGDSINGGMIDATTITMLTAGTVKADTLTGNSGNTVTLASGKTLDVSQGVLQLESGQISGDKIKGGAIVITNLTATQINVDTIGTTVKIAPGESLDVRGAALLVDKMSIDNLKLDGNAVRSTSGDLELMCPAGQRVKVGDTLAVGQLVMKGNMLNTTDHNTLLLSPHGFGSVKVAAGKTLDLRGVALLLDNDAITGDKVDGGLIHNITIVQLTSGQVEIGSLKLAGETISSTGDIKLEPAVGRIVEVPHTLQVDDLRLGRSTIRSVIGNASIVFPAEGGLIFSNVSCTETLRLLSHNTPGKFCKGDVNGEIRCLYEGTTSQVGLLTNEKWCTTDGNVVNCQANAPVLSEMDPKISSVTSGKLCKGTGTQVDCSFDETDPQVGAVTSGKLCKGDGSAVQCSYDEVDPQVGTVTDNKYCKGDGSGIVQCTADDRVGTLSASKWCTTDGNVVNCQSNAPVLSESDPKISSVTSGKLCKGTGTQVDCSFDETDPQVGTVTSGKLCKGDGSAVQCSYDEVDPQVGTVTDNKYCKGDGSGVVQCTADDRVGTLGASKWCTSDGSVVNCQTNAPVLTEADPKVSSVTSGKFCKGTGTQVDCSFDEADPQVGTVSTSGKWCRSDGSAIQCDQNVPVLSEADPQVGAVASGKLCKGDGSAVQCSYDEADPQVGTLENTKWCTSDGSVVNCQSNTPVLTETDPQVGSVTSGKLCKGDGSAVQCSYDEVDPKIGTLAASKWCTSDGSVVNCNQLAPLVDGGTIASGTITSFLSNSVGVGTTSPSTSLDVKGTARADHVEAQTSLTVGANTTSLGNGEAVRVEGGVGASGGFRDSHAWSSETAGRAQLADANGCATAPHTSQFAGSFFEFYDVKTAFSLSGDLIGSGGAIFDGRFVYFPPTPHGGFLALRYDTQAEFSVRESWSSFDLSSFCASCKGYEDGCFDGVHIYLPPYYVGSSVYNSRVVRYNTGLPFDDASSWTVFDVEPVVGANNYGYSGSRCIPGGVVLVPALHSGRPVVLHQRGGNFSSPSSWKLAHVSSVGLWGHGFDGKYIYLFGNGVDVVYRWDTELSFGNNTHGWASHNIGLGVNTGMGAAAFDSRFLYFPASGGKAIRLDTSSDFLSSSAWALSPSGIADTRDVITDSRHVYYVRRTLSRYDTQKPFSSSSAWLSIDLATLPQSPPVGELQFERGVLDGRFLYLSPSDDYNHVLRYDTRAPQSRPSLAQIATSSDLFIASNGSVGIGTKSPGERLSVEGGVRATRLGVVGTNLVLDGKRGSIHSSEGNENGTVNLIGDLLVKFESSVVQNSRILEAEDAVHVAQTRYYAGASIISSTFDPSTSRMFFTVYHTSSYGTQILSFDTRHNASDFEGGVNGWEIYEASIVDGLDTRGHYDGVICNGYYYVSQYNDPLTTPAVLRYKLDAPFMDSSSWSAFTIPCPLCTSSYHVVATCLNDAVYFMGYYPTSAFMYNTSLPFNETSSWKLFNQKQVTGDIYFGVAGSDGRHIFYAGRSHGKVLRYDSHSPFDNMASWLMIDATTHLSGVSEFAYGELGFVYPYMYFGVTGASKIVRYNTQGGFNSQGSWEAFDIGTIDGVSGLSNYQGCVAVGGNVLFVPGDGNKHVLRYETLADKWSVIDMSVSAMKWYGGWDGKYLYTSTYPSAGPNLIVRIEIDLDKPFRRIAPSNVIFTSNGKVGIGTTSPSEQLHVVGNIKATGTVTATTCCGSDIRLKKNITSLSGALETIKKMRGIRYKWKSNNEPSIGFVAQELEQVVPEVVVTGSDGYKAVDYGKLSAVLAVAMQEMEEKMKMEHKEVDELRSEMKKVGMQHNALIQRLESLEKAKRGSA